MQRCYRYFIINNIIHRISIYILNRSFINYISLKLGLKKLWENYITYIGFGWFVMSYLLCLIFEFFNLWGLRGIKEDITSCRPRNRRCDGSRTSPHAGPCSSCTFLLDPHPRQIMVCHVSPNYGLFSTFCPHTIQMSFVTSTQKLWQIQISFLFFRKLPSHPSSRCLPK